MDENGHEAHTAFSGFRYVAGFNEVSCTNRRRPLWCDSLLHLTYADCGRDQEAARLGVAGLLVSIPRAELTTADGCRTGISAVADLEEIERERMRASQQVE